MPIFLRATRAARCVTALADRRCRRWTTRRGTTTTTATSTRGGFSSTTTIREVDRDHRQCTMHPSTKIHNMKTQITNIRKISGSGIRMPSIRWTTERITAASSIMGRLCRRRVLTQSDAYKEERVAARTNTFSDRAADAPPHRSIPPTYLGSRSPKTTF